MKWMTGSHVHDMKNLERQFEVYDVLYTWCRLGVAGSESQGKQP